MPVLSGVVKDSSGAFAAMMVRVYDRNTGAFVGETISNVTNGAWSIPVQNTNEHFAVAHEGVAVTGDPLWKNVVLALPMEGVNGGTSFTDLKGHTVNNSSATITDTSKSKFGSSSGYFNGSTAYLELSNSADLNFETHDFTLDMWIYKVGGWTKTVRLFDKYTNTSSGIYMAVNSSGYFYGGVATGAYETLISSISVPTDTWSHLAFSKIENELRIFVDGQSGGTKTISGAPSAYAGYMRIGYDDLDTGNSFNGYMDNFRITSKIARYTEPFDVSNVHGFGYSSITGGDLNARIYDRLIPV